MKNSPNEPKTCGGIPRASSKACNRPTSGSSPPSGSLTVVAVLLKPCNGTPLPLLVPADVPVLLLLALPPCTKFTTLTPFSDELTAAASAELDNIDVLLNLTVGLVRLIVVVVVVVWPPVPAFNIALTADVDG